VSHSRCTATVTASSGDRHASGPRWRKSWVATASKTQVGRALGELQVEMIFANSPQAKGRIERLWGTFQDRLVSELRLAKVTTLEEANRFLPRYLARHNRRFAVAPADD
jgi:hypothetical protein